jgi:hypothetical protein
MFRKILSALLPNVDRDPNNDAARLLKTALDNMERRPGRMGSWHWEGQNGVEITLNPNAHQGPAIIVSGDPDVETGVFISPSHQYAWEWPTE